MTDLLSSLIRPSTSEESFHSTHSTHYPPSPVPPHGEITPGDPAHPFVSSQTRVQQPVYDVNAYLNEPTNMALLESGKRRKIQPDTSKHVVQSSMTSPDAPQLTTSEPVQLGPSKSSYHVSAFHELCQEKGFTPVFDIQEDLNVGQRFKGSLMVAGQTIKLEETQASKKEAKQVLAGKGYLLVQRMEAKFKRKDNDDSAENWIGKLLGT